MSIDRHAIARHEAAHGLVMAHLNLASSGFRMVILDEPDLYGRLGFVQRLDPNGERYADLDEDVDVEDAPSGQPSREYAHIAQPFLWRHAVYCYAGAAGQCPAAFSPRSGIELRQFSHGDRRQFAWLARSLGYEAPEFWWDAFDAACRIIDPRWGELEAIAGALEVRGELLSDEVLEIGHRAPPTVNARPLWDPNRVQNLTRTPPASSWLACPSGIE